MFAKKQLTLPVYPFRRPNLRKLANCHTLKSSRSPALNTRWRATKSWVLRNRSLITVVVNDGVHEKSHLGPRDQRRRRPAITCFSHQWRWNFVGTFRRFVEAQKMSQYMVVMINVIGCKTIIKNIFRFLEHSDGMPFDDNVFRYLRSCLYK